MIDKENPASAIDTLTRSGAYNHAASKSFAKRKPFASLDNTDLESRDSSKGQKGRGKLQRLEASETHSSAAFNLPQGIGDGNPTRDQGVSHFLAEAQPPKNPEAIETAEELMILPQERCRNIHCQPSCEEKLRAARSEMVPAPQEVPSPFSRTSPQPMQQQADVDVSQLPCAAHLAPTAATSGDEVMMFKTLTVSDVSKSVSGAGRIILPRNQVESCLPDLLTCCYQPMALLPDGTPDIQGMTYSKSGIELLFDDNDGHKWRFVLKTWANGQIEGSSRARPTWVMEHTASFVEHFGLVEGDKVLFCRRDVKVIIKALRTSSPAYEDARMMLDQMKGLHRCKKHVNCTKLAGHKGFCSGQHPNRKRASKSLAAPEALPPACPQNSTLEYLNDFVLKKLKPHQSRKGVELRTGSCQSSTNCTGTAQPRPGGAMMQKTTAEPPPNGPQSQGMFQALLDLALTADSNLASEVHSQDVVQTRNEASCQPSLPTYTSSPPCADAHLIAQTGPLPGTAQDVPGRVRGQGKKSHSHVEYYEDVDGQNRWIEVMCGEARGRFNIYTWRVLCLDGKHEGEIVLPSHFERIGGRGICKKWRQSLVVLLSGHEDGAMMQLGTWLARNNMTAPAVPISGSRSRARSPPSTVFANMNPDELDTIHVHNITGGLEQHAAANVEQTNNTRQGKLTTSKDLGGGPSHSMCPQSSQEQQACPVLPPPQVQHQIQNSGSSKPTDDISELTAGSFSGWLTAPGAGRKVLGGPHGDPLAMAAHKSQGGDVPVKELRSLGSFPGTQVEALPDIPEVETDQEQLPAGSAPECHLAFSSHRDSIQPMATVSAHHNAVNTSMHMSEITTSAIADVRPPVVGEAAKELQALPAAECELVVQDAEHISFEDEGGDLALEADSQQHQKTQTPPVHSHQSHQQGGSMVGNVQHQEPSAQHSQQYYLRQLTEAATALGLVELAKAAQLVTASMGMGSLLPTPPPLQTPQQGASSRTPRINGRNGDLGRLRKPAQVHGAPLGLVGTTISRPPRKAPGTIQASGAQQMESRVPSHLDYPGLATVCNQGALPFQFNIRLPAGNSPLGVLSHDAGYYSRPLAQAQQQLHGPAPQARTAAATYQASGNPAPLADNGRP